MDMLYLILAAIAEDQAKVIFQRVRAGDPQALADLYDLFGRVLHVVIYRIVNDRGVAEDLVQETFLRAWNRASQWREDVGLVGPWLLSIARNCALDYKKSAHVRYSVQMPEHMALPSSSFEGEILSSERAEMIRRGLQDLTADEKQVLHLAYFEGLTQSEIAVKMAKPLGTVKSWTRSALMKMRSSAGELTAQ